jgi:hypothetical protein
VLYLRKVNNSLQEKLGSMSTTAPFVITKRRDLHQQLREIIFKVTFFIALSSHHHFLIAIGPASELAPLTP